MSYIPFRDNKDLAGVDPVDRVALVGLSEVIDESSSRSLHADQCSQFCDKGEACQYWRHHMASSEETLGWLVGQGLLDPARVLQWLKENR
jgi:hypothetical protein